MPLELLSSESLETGTYDPIRWVWDETLATGMVTLLTSRWKAGKTTLVSVLLSKLGTGGALAGGNVAPARAIVVSEEPATLWQHRQRRLGFPPDTRFCCRPFHVRPTQDEWVNFLLELAAEKPDLVVFDPLAMVLPGSVENNAIALLNALEPLHVLTAEGCAVLLVHHPRKANAPGDLSPRGSGALTGFADILADLDRPPSASPSDRRRRLRITSRLTGSTSRLIELTADGKDYTLLPEPADVEGFESGWPVLEMVLEDASQRPTRRGLLKAWPEDYEAPSKNTLIRWLERAEKEGLIVVRGTGRRSDAYCYGLSDQEFDADKFEKIRRNPLSWRTKKKG